MKAPAFWFKPRPTGATRLLAGMLRPASLVYAAGAALHRGAYRRGWLRSGRLPCYVISVGGLSVGGSGKTPVAAWLARALHVRGHRVVLATRGYGRRSSEAVTVVSDGRHAIADPARAGDEPWILAAHAPGVPVLVGRDRHRVGLRACSAFGAEILVLDDGFQHHRLHRDLDVVCLDAASLLGNGCVLPRGPLRESPRALGFADAIVVVDGPLEAAAEHRLDGLARHAFRVEARRAATHVRPLAGLPVARRADAKTSGRPPAEALAGEAVGLVSGIARPEGLRASVEALGARVIAERSFPDHHRFRPRDLAGCETEARHWITTEKDAMKILPQWVPKGVLLDVLGSRIEVTDPERWLSWIEARSAARRRVGTFSDPETHGRAASSSALSTGSTG